MVLYRSPKCIGYAHLLNKFDSTWVPDTVYQSKRISNDQELIQPDPTSCP